MDRASACGALGCPFKSDQGHQRWGAGVVQQAGLENHAPLMAEREFESRPHRQSEKEVAGSPSARDRQPILGANWNFLSLSRFAEGQKQAF